MTLRSGDTVNLSIKPRVQLSQYDSISGMASVTRTLGDDIEQDLAEMRAAVRKQALTAVQIEIELRREFEGIQASPEDLSDLYDYCVKELQDERPHVEKVSPGGDGRRVKAPTKKGPTRKAKGGLFP